MAYDAGTAFLQIVPSFRGLEKNLQQGVRAIAAGLEGAVSDALPKGVAEGSKRAEAEADKSGHRTGDRFVGAFINKIKGAASQAARQLPDIKIKGDTSAIDVRLDQIRKRLIEISDTKITPDFDGERVLREMQELSVELRAIQKQAGQGVDVPFNAGSAADILGELDKVVDYARAKGAQSAGAFARSFKDAAAAADLALPDIEIPEDAAENDLRRLVGRLKTQLKQYGQLDIGTQISGEEAVFEFKRVMAELDVIARDQNVEIQTRIDADTSARAIKGLLDRVDKDTTELGTSSGRRYVGAFAEGVKANAKKAADALGDIEVDLDTTAAQLQLASLVQEMRTISARVGVDLDATAAQKRLVEILTEIKAVQAAAGEGAELKFNTRITGDILAEVEKLTAEVEDKVEQGGDAAGKKFSGAFATEVHKIVQETAATLGDIEIGVNADTSPAAVKLQVLKKELDDLNTLIELGLDPTLVLARLHEIHDEVKAIQRDAAGTDLQFGHNAGAAADVLARGQALERKARSDGREAGGAFNAEFSKTVESAHTALPNIELTADSNDFEKRIAAVKAQLAELKDKRIGIDLDDAEAIAKAKALQAELEDIAKNAPTVHLRADADASRKSLQSFTTNAGRDDFGTDASDTSRKQEQQAERDAGAYLTRFRALVDAAKKSLPEIDIDVESSTADKVLDDIRLRLGELGDKTIGVDISADDARKDLLQLQERLQLLRDDKNITLDVKANTEAALHEIDKFFDQAGNGVGPFTARIRAGLAKVTEGIPDIELNADTSSFDLTLARIKAQLQDTRQLNIRGDLNDADALAKIQTLRIQLELLAKLSPDIDVKVNAATAIAELKRIEAESDNASNSVGDVGNSASGGIGRLAALIAVGASLGTIVVPAAAAAAAAIGGIGLAAGSVIAAVGVAALGLYGIGDAVKALSAAHDDQAKTAKSLGASNTALSRTQDAVTSAKRSYTKTVADAADAEVSARERVADSERSLATAQAEEKQTRQALNEAYKEAKQDLADLNLSLAQNSLNQREARTAIAVEKAKLDAVLSNPRATTIERQQAQQSYEEKVLQLKDLQNKGKKLQSESDEYAKKGLAANSKVQSARKAEKAAVDRVGGAVRGVNDAQRAQAKTARDNAASIASAQQAITNAQLSASQAVTSSAAAGGSALDNLNTAFAKLTPTGQNFAKYIYGLKGDFQGLVGAAQDSLLPGVQTGIGILLKHLEPLKDFVSRVGSALGGIFTDFANSLDDPVFKDFFGFFDKTAVPALEATYEATKNIVKGITILFLAMAPFAGNFLSGLVQTTQDFADMASNLVKSNGYAEFVQYVVDNTPKVITFFENVITFVGHFITAAAPIGSTVLDALNGVFGFLNDISGVDLTAILSGIAIFATLFVGLGGVVSAIGKLKDVFGPVLNVLKTVGTYLRTTYVASAEAAALATGDLTTKQRIGAGVSGTFATTIGKIFSPASLAVIGLTALAVILTTVYAKHLAAKEAAKEQITSLVSLAATIKAANGDISDASVVSAINGDSKLQQLTIDADKYGISLDTVSDSLQGNADAQKTVLDRYDEQITKLQKVKKAQEDAANAADQKAQTTGGYENYDPTSKNFYKERLLPGYKTDAQKAADKTNTDLDKTKGERDSLAGTYAQLQKNAEAEKILTESRRISANQLAIDNIPKTAAQTGALQANQAQIDKLTAQINQGYLAAAGDATAKASVFKDMLDTQKVSLQETNAALGDHDNKLKLTVAQYDTITNAQETFSSGLATLATTVTNAKKAHDNHATSLAFDSTNLEKNSAQAIANRDAIQNLATQSRDAFLADIAAGVSTDTATKAHEKRIDALKREAHHLGLDDVAVNKLIDSQGKISPKIETEFQSKKFDEAYKQLQQLNFMQEQIKEGKSADEAAANYKRYSAGLANTFNYQYSADPFGAGKATGGPIHGPGTPTSDSIPIMASTGEFMQQAKAVDYYGLDLMHALNRRDIPREILGLAKGGPVAKTKTLKAPVTVDYSKMTIATPSVQQAADIALAQVGGTGGTVIGSEKVAEAAESTARAMKATTKMLIALMEAGIVESGLQNLSYGDRDSLGFLQQRAGWGTASQRRDVRYATRKFIDKAKRVDKSSYNAGELAQAVQVSSFGSKYEKQHANAVAVLNRNAPYLTAGADGGSVANSGTGSKKTLIAFGRWLQKQGYTVSENPAFGGVGTHSENSLHYTGDAIDVNHGSGTSAAEQAYLTDVLADAHAAGLRTIFMYPGHYNHLHVDDGKGANLGRATGDRNGVNFPGYATGGALPANALSNAALAKFQRMAVSAGTYDSGGWLPPGVNQIVNASGKPEAVFSNSQFRDISSLVEATRQMAMSNTGGGSGNTFQFDFAHSTLDQARLASMQARANSLARINRPNF